MRYRTVAIVLLVVGLLSSSIAVAQASRAEEERRRKQASEAHKAKVGYREEGLPDWLLLDYGGNTSLIYEKIGNKYSRLPSISAFTSDTNVWLDLELQNTHRFYSRFRMTYLDEDFTNNTEFHGFAGDLEELYYLADLGNLFKIREVAGQRFQGQVTVGRQYFTLGHGLTYSDISDGIKGEIAWGKLRTQLWGAKTIGYYANIDTSVPGRDNDRRFFAGEMRYELSKPFQPYIFFMTEDDHSDEHPRDPFRNYSYNARYLGLGAEGEPLPGLTYYAEYIRQSGTTMGESIENRAIVDPFGFTTYVPTPMNIHKDPIRAYAVDMGMDYEVKHPGRPVFSLGYIHGSGDADRLIPGSTIGGNLAHTHDRGFMEFGYVPVGYVLDPMVSNLHIYRAGFSINPFYDRKTFESLRFGFTHYVFQKDKLTGGISDQAAIRDHKGVGQELDFFATWDPLRDVSVGVEYGMFFPGRAFERRRMNDYFMFNFTYRF
ncbi:MAG: alginate export family protein [Planctomycetes bacterium]|nr:alginate export family protein [Planctomycetota bacterium]